MPIKKGNTTIGAIYKGTTQIAKVYKGTTLLFENAVWLDYYFSNLYHSLVPVTIPKNLFDGELEVGWINSSGGLTTDTNTFRSTNYSSVKGSTTYTLSCSLTGFTNVYYYEYDENKTFTRYSGSLTFNQSISITTQSSTRYLKFAYYKNGANFTNNLPTKQEANIQLYSKSYSVKNKAKVAKIYANGVVENQLVSNGNFEDTTGIVITEPSYESVSVSSNKATFTLLNNISSGVNSYFACQTQVIGHKYLIWGTFKGESGANNTIYLGLKSSNYVIDTVNVGQEKIIVGILTADSAEVSVFTRLAGAYSTGQSFSVRKLQLTDLTLKFGTGNEPTALTDNRIQALLNRDYTPYNAGTYKGTDIGEFSSEPYNLFDGELEVGAMDASGNLVANTTCFRTIDYIKVQGGKTYTYEVNNAGSNTINNYIVYEYDSDKNLITRQIKYSNNSDFTLNNNTQYVKFISYAASDVVLTGIQICFHRTGTRTGYAPHQTFTPISFRYQGNGAINTHDTMEITKDNVVFVKNVGGNDDISSLSFGINQEGTNTYRFAVSLSNALSNGVGICNRFTWKTSGFSSDEELIGVLNGTLYIRILKSKLNNTYTAQALHDWLVANKTDIHYELATPQTITIPRKYMGVVDLGSLNWSKTTGTSGTDIYFYSGDLVGTIKAPSSNSTLANIYSNEFLTVTHSKNYTRNGNIGIAVTNTGNVSCAGTKYDSMTATDFKSAMAGIYLYYETATEVADITDTLDIEAGGTITTDSEVLPNVDMKIKCK